RRNQRPLRLRAWPSESTSNGSVSKLNSCFIFQLQDRKYPTINFPVSKPFSSLKCWGLCRDKYLRTFAQVLNRTGHEDRQAQLVSLDLGPAMSRLPCRRLWWVTLTLTHPALSTLTMGFITSSISPFVIYKRLGALP